MVAKRPARVVGASDEAGPVASGPEIPLPRRTVWPVLVVLALVLAGGALGAWRLITRPDPLRVLVAIDVDGQWWQGSKAAARLADSVAKRLKELGFEVVRGGDPETIARLEAAGTPEAGARALKAAFVLSGRMPLTANELPVVDKLHEVRVEGRLELRDIEETDAFLDAPLAGFACQAPREKALDLAVDSMVDVIVDATVPALVGHPRIRALAESKDARIVDRLAPARKYAELRKVKLDEADSAYAKLEQERLEGEKAPHRPVFVSGPRADDRLVAAGTKGLLIATAAVEPFYSHAQLELYRRLQLETLEWRDPESASGAVVWSGYNAFTYPSAARDGAPVVLIEDLYGAGRSVVLVDASGKATRLRNERTLKLSEPKVAPDGSKVALVERDCVGCAPALVVLDLRRAGAPELFRINAWDHVGYGGSAWLDGSRLLVAFASTAERFALSDGVRAALWVVDLASGKGEALFVAPKGTQLADPVASADGALAAVVARGARDLVVVDLARRRATNYPLEGIADGPTFSPDGQRIAFAYSVFEGGPPEIAVMSRNGGDVTRLTENRYDDFNPHYSLDGKRIYFETVARDPVFRGKRHVKRVAWVPAP